MHIVAGSMEALMLLAKGQHAAVAAMSHFFFPVLAGVVRGTALFTLLSYAQVMKEI
jgi:formate-nitrite transporter family protein